MHATLKNLIDVLRKEKIEFTGIATIALLNEGEQQMNKIAKTVRRTNAGVTGTVDRLEKKNLVYRERATDRRKVMVGLTIKGQQVAARINQILSQGVETTRVIVTEGKPFKPIVPRQKQSTEEPK